MAKVDTKEIPEVKSLRWLANMFPKVDNPQDVSDKLSTCIHLYCTAGANLLECYREKIDRLHHFEVLQKEGRLVVLDAPMVPVKEDEDELSSDVFCPRCNENLSGAYGDEERLLLQCPKCGQYIDGTKSMTPEEAAAWLEEEG